MGRYAEKHSQQQRDAVIAAQLEGMSAEEAVERAGAGELGLEPFSMSPSQARDLAAEARRERGSDAVPHRPGPPADQAEAEERAFLEAQIARIKSLPKPTAKDLHAMRTAMAALRDIEKHAARRRVHQPPQPAENGELSPWLKRMIVAFEAEKRAEVQGRELCWYSLPYPAGPKPERETRPCISCGRPADEHEVIHPRCYGDGEW